MELNKKLTLLILIIINVNLTAQKDGLSSKLSFNGDYRFRIEEDWNSKKSDGSLRSNRTRMRYRLRAGLTFNDKWATAGIRIRTGIPSKQQDPQLTLGDENHEFSTLPLGFEQAYLQLKTSGFAVWFGKNTYPYQKNNELFWSDNVYPEGISIIKGYGFKESSKIDSLDIRLGHFIIATENNTLQNDSYFQGLQLYSSFYDGNLKIFPSLFIFRNIDNIPDGNGTFKLNYTFLHLGIQFKLNREFPLTIELDYYQNMEDYKLNNNISDDLVDQKKGYVVGLKYGNLQKNGDWMAELNATYLERFAAVDFMAQNDWARWDYSSNGSLDGRLTNLKGIEVVGRYKVNKQLKLVAKYYFVQQLVSYGISKETGSRVRFDIDFTL